LPNHYHSTHPEIRESIFLGENEFGRPFFSHHFSAHYLMATVVAQAQGQGQSGLSLQDGRETALFSRNASTNEAAFRNPSDPCLEQMTCTTSLRGAQLLPPTSQLGRNQTVSQEENDERKAFWRSEAMSAALPSTWI